MKKYEKQIREICSSIKDGQREVLVVDMFYHKEDKRISSDHRVWVCRFWRESGEIFFSTTLEERPHSMDEFIRYLQPFCRIKVDYFHLALEEEASKALDVRLEAWRNRKDGAGEESFLKDVSSVGVFKNGEHWISFDDRSLDCWVDEFLTERDAILYAYGYEKQSAAL